MLKIHHLGISQSERVVWLCEELELEYMFQRYERREDNQSAPDEYKALHPAGTAPIIEDGDIVLAESGAICEYIDRKYGDSRHSPGPDHPDFGDHLFWMHFANGTFITNGMMQLMLSLTKTRNPTLDQFVAERNAKAWNLVEARLMQAEYFGGEQLTLADIMMFYCLTTSRMIRHAPPIDRPATQSYLRRIGKREAYQRAWEKCEPGVQPYLG